MGRWMVVLAIGFLTGISGWTQNSADRSAVAPDSTAQPAPPSANSTVAHKWHFFVDETFGPMTPAAGAFNAGVSQITNSDPRYGVGAEAYAERFGASTADIVTQNFFGDFVMASVFHQDTRYLRQGPAYGSKWKRAGYAIGRAFITQKDEGGSTFNWSNATGTALSTGFSNLYYPAASRTGGAMAIHFATSLIGGGLANLYPEFWPGFRDMLARHHLFPRAH
jgi:hypothetical protein